MTQPDDFTTDLVSLSPADAQVLDALLSSLADEPSLKLAQWQASTAQAVPADAGAEKERVKKISQVVGLLGCCDVQAAPDDLMQRTLGRVEEARQRQRFAQQVHALSGGSGGRFRWADLLTVAAIMLIGASLLLPVLNRMRGDARQAACANNLAVAGTAIGRYGTDHGNILPRGKVRPGTVWWNVGQPNRPEGLVQSNSAHLYILVRKHYVHADSLHCPDNPWAADRLDDTMFDWPNAKAVSYSYQNQYTPKATRIDQVSEMAILADKNPMFVSRSDKAQGLTYRADLAPTTSSIFHQGHGQNLLTTSGRVMWQTKPIGPNGDNIWLIRGVSSYKGIEAPQDADDSFLVP